MVSRLVSSRSSIQSPLRGSSLCWRLVDRFHLAADRFFLRRPLQQRILLQLAIHIGGEVEMRQLQELDRLHQLRRHHQSLALTH